MLCLFRLKERYLAESQSELSDSRSAVSYFEIIKLLNLDIVPEI
jgi:hypothetical protein